MIDARMSPVAFRHGAVAAQQEQFEIAWSRLAMLTLCGVFWIAMAALIAH